MSGSAATLDLESIPTLAVDGGLEVRETNPPEPPPRGVAPVVFNGRIDPPGDEDRFQLVVTPGQKLQIDVEAADNGSASTACSR